MFEFLDNAYNINSGGCCFVASVLAKLLEQDGVNFSVIVYDCDYDDFYDLDCSQYHYTLQIGDRIVNGYEDDDDYAEYYNVSSKDLLEHYKECGDWNEVYNRKRNNYIKRVIKDFYNDFTRDLREEQPKSNSKR